MRLATYRIRQVELEVNTNIVLNKKSRDLAKFYNFAKKLVRSWPDRPDRFRRPCEKLIKKQTYMETETCKLYLASFFEHFRQISSKSIVIISSSTVSNLVLFLRHRVYCGCCRTRDCWIEFVPWKQSWWNPEHQRRRILMTSCDSFMTSSKTAKPTVWCTSLCFLVFIYALSCCNCIDQAFAFCHCAADTFTISGSIQMCFGLYVFNGLFLSELSEWHTIHFVDRFSCRQNLQTKICRLLCKNWSILSADTMVWFYCLT